MTLTIAAHPGPQPLSTTCRGCPAYHTSNGADIGRHGSCGEAASREIHDRMEASPAVPHWCPVLVDPDAYAPSVAATRTPIRALAAAALQRLTS